MNQRPLIIVGGGVGGLTAALALHRMGVSKTKLVLKEGSLSESGGAVCVMQGAVRILDRLGLGSKVRTMGLPTQYGELYTSRGKKLFDVDLNDYGSEMFVLPRPQLRQAFLEALPPDCVTFHTKFKRFDDNSDTVTVHLKDLKSSLEYRVDTDILVGADGSRSAVRSFLAKPGASQSHNVAVFRATVSNSDLKTYPMHVLREVWGDSKDVEMVGTRFGFVRMTPNDVFWWASLPGALDSCSHLSNQRLILRPFARKLAERFQSFPFEAAKLLKSTAEMSIERTEVRAFKHRCPWATGRVVLLGDAARQSDLTYFHHGSTLAIQDGYSLALALAGGRIRSKTTERTLPALRTYEQERREQTFAVQRQWELFDSLARARSWIMRHAIAKMLQLRLAQYNSGDSIGGHLGNQSLKEL